jgi:hypothetical protein
VPYVPINVRIVQAKAEANGGRKTYLSSKEVPESFVSKQHLNFVGMVLSKFKNRVDGSERYETPAGKASA